MNRFRPKPAAPALRNAQLACSVLAAGAIVLAASMLVHHLTSPDRDRLSLSCCQIVEARVIGKGQSLQEKHGMQFTLYHLRYALTLDGRTIENQGRVSPEWYNWIETGNSVNVYIDPEAPDRNFLALEREFLLGNSWRTAIVAAAAGCIFLILALRPAVLLRLLPKKSAATQPVPPEPVDV